jgi:dihydroflavonol-4-reductase
MILVTGANGRVGNVLVKELESRGYKVKVFVREKSDLTSLEGCNCDYAYGDILKRDTIAKALVGVDVVFHLAGFINISPKDRDITMKVNIEGTKNIADLCLEKNVPLIYSSSIHAIDAPEDNSLITEDTPLATNLQESRGAYDYSKAIATEYILEQGKKGLKYIVFHPTGIIGPYDYEPSFFGSGMISLIKSGIKFNIGGKYDYVDVRDVVGAMIEGYEKEKWGERYILSGGVLDMKEYISYIKEFTNIYTITKIIGFNLSLLLGNIVFLFKPKGQITPYSVKTLYSNSNVSHAKATKEIEYAPISVKESLKDQYNWFKEKGYL